MARQSRAESGLSSLGSGEQSDSRISRGGGAPRHWI